jgi:hypothetical protein
MATTSAITPERRLLRKRQAKVYLGDISDTALWRLQSEGKITPLRIGRAVYFDIANLDSYVDSLRVADKPTNLTN